MMTQEEFMNVKGVEGSGLDHPATISGWLKAEGPPPKRSTPVEELVIDEHWRTRHPDRPGLDRVAVRPRQGRVAPPAGHRRPRLLRAELAVVRSCGCTTQYVVPRTTGSVVRCTA